MQKETPITNPLCRSVQCLWPFLIVRPKKDSHQRLSEWQSLVRACPPVRIPRPAGGPRSGDDLKRNIVMCSVAPIFGTILFLF